MTLFDLNRGAIAPVADEVDLVDIPFSGTLPRELRGTLLRNGPNPLSGRFTGNDVLSWWPESAMLHALSFEDGRVIGYRNRWVRTRRWTDVHAPEESVSALDTNPNVNVISHAGELLALSEGGPPLAIDPSLESFARPTRHTGLGGGMTAHPKVDPRTGEMMVFRSDWNTPWLQYGVYDAQGRLRVDMSIDAPAPSMMHDMAITATHTILLDLNVAYDFSMLSRGHRMPLRWHDDRRARLGVIPRHGGTTTWFEIEPCFILHVVNAYDIDASTIVFDAVRYASYLKLGDQPGTFEENPTATLWRYVIDLARGVVQEAQLAGEGIELPRINENRTGAAYRYLYAAEQPTNVEFRGIVRYDLERGTCARFAVEPGDQNSEPVFVPRFDARTSTAPRKGDDNDAQENGGWLLTWIYRHATDTSDLVVLDARHIESGPVATVHLPRRVPAGFHGAWVPAIRQSPAP